MLKLIKSNAWVKISLTLLVVGFFNYVLRLPFLPSEVPLIAEIGQVGSKYDNTLFFGFTLLVYFYFLWQIGKQKESPIIKFIGIFNLVWVSLISFFVSIRFLQVLKTPELNMIPEWYIWISIPYFGFLMIFGLPILIKRILS